MNETQNMETSNDNIETGIKQFDLMRSHLDKKFNEQ